MEETFSVTTQVNGKTKETPLIRIQYLEWLFGRVFIANVLRHARRAMQLNPRCNHKKYAIPAGNAYDDKAPEETLIKKDSMKHPIKKIKYKQKECGLCFGYSFANALYQMGYKKESCRVANMAME